MSCRWPWRVSRRCCWPTPSVFATWGVIRVVLGCASFFPEIIGFIVFMIASFAETNRVPFDLPEAENELVAGFHTEYSSMNFAAFFMAEYANMVTVTAVATLLFLGGWQPPFPAPYSDAIPILIFAVAGLIAVYHGLNPT